MLVGQTLQLDLVKTDNDNWQQLVREHIHEGRNFFLVLPSGSEAVKSFCRQFGLEEDCLPKEMKRADFLRMSQYVGEGVFEQVLAAFSARQNLYFLEQLDFSYNRPPHVKPFVLYSPTFGILSQHDTELEARKALAAHESSTNVLRYQTEAVIYRFDGRKWVMED
jgi:hypothetical protein